MPDSEKDPNKLMWLEDRDETIDFVTNSRRLAASTIAAIYRGRRQIVLFKAIRQSPRIKTFAGTSKNAVRIQTWTALISNLLLRCLNARPSWRWSFSNRLALPRQQIFVYRDPWKLLNQPDQPPAEMEETQPSVARQS